MARSAAAFGNYCGRKDLVSPVWAPGSEQELQNLRAVLLSTATPGSSPQHPQPSSSSWAEEHQPSLGLNIYLSTRCRTLSQPGVSSRDSSSIGQGPGSEIEIARDFSSGI